MNFVSYLLYMNYCAIFSIPLLTFWINVTLFDMSGKQIFLGQDLGNSDVFTFPTSNLSTGIYIVTFTTDNGLTKARKINVTNR